MTSTSATLTWKAPADLGDDEQKVKYVVERRAATRTIWQKVTTTKETSVTVEELSKGTKYYFRVRAENPQGQSEPVQIGPIEIQEKPEGKLYGFSNQSTVSHIVV